MTERTQILEPGTLPERVTRRTEQALACGALESLPSKSTYIDQHGIRFLVRILASLERKGASRAQDNRQTTGTTERFNPFLPYDADLFVTEVSETHVCLLNKFNVADFHLLIVTRAFEDQESPLTLADFQALWTCMVEIEGLAFYNAGKAAGASQHHKHLQLVPLPLTPSGPRIPMEPLLQGAEPFGAVEAVRDLPFPHALVRFDGSLTASPGEAASILLTNYQVMLQQLGLRELTGRRATTITPPYNLLATRDWMLLVPRSRACFESISVNALGFAGTFLVKNVEQLRILEQHGPMTTLQEVAAANPAPMNGKHKIP